MDSAQGTPRIMIVDDMPTNLQVLGTMLSNAGYVIYLAGDGVQAIQKSARILPDLILLDIMMPDLDGLATCERLKMAAETKDIPVIFLTAKDSKEDIVRGLEVGGVDYVTKPFNASELLARVKTQLELKSQRDLIERSEREKRELLHVLCHDLANPFSSIVGSLEYLRREPDTTMRERFEEEMLKVASHGMEIIEMVRKMSALEERKIQVDVEPVNLRRALRLAELILQGKFSAKNVSLNVEVDDDVHVMAEEVQLVNSVLCNLLTNAVKFSFPGSTVDVRAVAVGDRLELSVFDHGVGIPAVIQGNMFELAKTTSRKGTDGELGTGFGMPLVRKFVEAFGGVVSVSSKDIADNPEGHGTEIKIILRRGPAPTS